jgi:hypothetical protein
MKTANGNNVSVIIIIINGNNININNVASIMASMKISIISIIVNGG